MQEPVKPTVLVVDDDLPIVEVVCEMLDEVQIAAAGCTQSQMAYPWIRVHRPQVVLLDVQMPGFDGVEVFRQLRADPLTCAIPVIFFTANAPKLQQRLPDYQTLGVALLPKPFDVETLLGAVTRALHVPGRAPSAVHRGHA
jgi:CheY-like chemotaxis protein